jgi:hypothetical protein
VAGVAGDAGAAGPQGPQGAAGEVGDQGPQGASAIGLQNPSLFDEFLGGLVSGVRYVGQLNWEIGSGSTTDVLSTSEPGRPGILQIRSSASNVLNTTKALRLGTSSTELVLFTNEPFDMVWSVRESTNPGNIRFVRVGLVDHSEGNPPAKGIYFEMDLLGQGDMKWRAVTKDGAAVTFTDTGVTFTPGTWYNLRIRRTSSGGMEFFLDGASVATHAASSVPPGALNLCFQFANITGANSFFQIDYFKIGFSGLARPTAE